jgi:hypothetical protein
MPGVVPKRFLLAALDREPMIRAPCEYVPSANLPGRFASNALSKVLLDT